MAMINLLFFSPEGEFRLAGSLLSRPGGEGTFAFRRIVMHR